jgi:cytochrome P450
MVMSEGHVWKGQRDAFNPGFSSSFLKTALPGFISCTEHLVQRLEAAADQREVVQLHHLTVLTTLEVICKVWQSAELDEVDCLRCCAVTGLVQALPSCHQA